MTRSLYAAAGCALLTLAALYAGPLADQLAQFAAPALLSIGENLPFIGRPATLPAR